MLPVVSTASPKTSIFKEPNQGMVIRHPEISILPGNSSCSNRCHISLPSSYLNESRLGRDGKDHLPQENPLIISHKTVQICIDSSARICNHVRHMQAFTDCMHSLSRNSLNMAPARKLRRRLSSENKRLAFRLGMISNRFAWFIRWALHTRSENYRIDIKPPLQHIIKELVGVYPNNAYGNIVDIILSLRSRIESDCNNDLHVGHLSSHGYGECYSEAVKLFLAIDPFTRDLDALVKTRKKIDRLFIKSYELVREIEDTLRNDSKCLNLNSIELLVHQDIFDLGQLLDQLVYPKLEESQFDELVSYWCSWKYFYLELDKPPDNADKIEIFVAMKKLNAEVLNDQLSKLEWRKVSNEPDISVELRGKMQPFTFEPLDLPGKLRSIIIDHDLSKITIDRIRVLADRLSINKKLTECVCDVNIDQSNCANISECICKIEEALLSKDKSTSSVSKSKKKSNQYVRNMWIYNQRKGNEYDPVNMPTLDTLCKRLNKKIKDENLRHWTPLKSGKSLHVTLQRFIREEGLPPLNSNDDR